MTKSDQLMKKCHIKGQTSEKKSHQLVRKRHKNVNLSEKK